VRAQRATGARAPGTVSRVVRRVGTDGEEGMTTAEYAVGTVAACGFAGVLFKLLTSDSVVRMLKDIVERALTIAF
jgi:hypothetical protein